MHKIILIVLIGLTATRCTKEEIVPRGYPVVVTRLVVDVSNGGASFLGEITFTPGPVVEYGFIWNAVRAPTLTDPDSEVKSLGSKNEAGSFEYKVPGGLVRGKTYAMRAYAKSNEDLVYGRIIEFVAQ